MSFSLFHLEQAKREISGLLRSNFVLAVSRGPSKLCFVCSQMAREIAIMKKISFDANIVQFYGACTDGTGAWLMMEYMEVSSSSLRTARPYPLLTSPAAACIIRANTCLCFNFACVANLVSSLSLELKRKRCSSG